MYVNSSDCFMVSKCQKVDSVPGEAQWLAEAMSNIL